VGINARLKQKRDRAFHLFTTGLLVGAGQNDAAKTIVNSLVNVAFSESKNATHLAIERVKQTRKKTIATGNTKEIDLFIEEVEPENAQESILFHEAQIEDLLEAEIEGESSNCITARASHMTQREGDWNKLQ
jgi:hypothetical protein